MDGLNGVFWTLMLSNYTEEELDDLRWWCRQWESIFAYRREHGMYV